LENKVTAPIRTTPSAPRLRRTRAFATALMCLYLVSGLLINLHLIDHHGAQPHTHHVHHTSCPDTEWSRSHDCFDHYMLDDHSVGTTKITRIISGPNQTAVLPSSLFNRGDEQGRLVPVSPDITGHLHDPFCSAPTRAPPADIRTV